MKNLVTILLIALVFTSCSKENLKQKSSHKSKSDLSESTQSDAQTQLVVNALECKIVVHKKSDDSYTQVNQLKAFYDSNEKENEEIAKSSFYWHEKILYIEGEEELNAIRFHNGLMKTRVAAGDYDNPEWFFGEYDEAFMPGFSMQIKPFQIVIFDEIIVAHSCKEIEVDSTRENSGVNSYEQWPFNN